MRCQSVCDIWDSWNTGCWDTPPVEPRRGSYVARAPPPRVHLGREPINLEWSADVRFGAHNGLKSDIAPCPKHARGHFRNSLVVWIGDDIEQLLHTVTPDRRNDPELGKMGPDCIDHRGLLTDEQMAGAMEHQATLLFGGLGWYKAHVGPGDCLANGLRVSRIVLLPLDVGLHIGRWDQPHGVTQCLELARPVVRRGAGFDTDQTGRQLLEERQDVAALQLAANDHLAASVDAVNLEN